MHYYEQRTTNYQLYSTNVECSLQIHLFLKNKANFQKSQVNVSDLLAREYEQMDTWSNRKNKANSNPIQTQFKANTNPKRTQFKPKQSQFIVSLSNLFQRQKILLRLIINHVSKSPGRFSALLLGYFQRAFTARAGYCFVLVVGWDFQFQTAKTGQKDELIDPSHNVVDLAHLGFEACLLFGFCAGLADRDFFFGKSGNGNDRFCVCNGAKRVRVVFERCPVGHIAQNSYPFANWRMCTGQVGKLPLPFFLEWIGYIHRGRNFIRTGKLWRRIVGDFFQRAGEPLGIAGQAGGACVGKIFTSSRKCEIKQLGHYWSQNCRDYGYYQHNDSGLPASLTAGRGPSASAHRAIEHAPQEYLRQQNDRAEHYPGQRDEEDIAVQDMAYLVCDDTLQLIAVETPEKARGYGDRCRLGASAGRKSIGGRVVDDINFWHCGQGGRDFHLLDHVEKLWMDIVGHRFCSAGGQENLVTLRKADPGENKPDYRGDNNAEKAAFVTKKAYADEEAQQYQAYCHCHQQQYGVSFIDPY